MSSDKDQGPGNEDRFPAEELERLYTLGGCDPALRILGSELNKILRRPRYEPDAWYVVTNGTVKKL